MCIVMELIHSGCYPSSLRNCTLTGRYEQTTAATPYDNHGEPGLIISAWPYRLYSKLFPSIFLKRIDSFVLTLLECGSDKFITYTSTHVINLLHIPPIQNNRWLLFAMAPLGLPWRAPKRQDAYTSGRPDIQISKLPSVQTSKYPNFRASRRPEAKTPILLDVRRLYFQVSRRLNALTYISADVYTPGCMDTWTSIRLDVQMSYAFTSRCLDVYTPGCMDARTSKRLDVCTSRYLSVCTPGCMHF
jgi:hypothetical protein